MCRQLPRTGRRQHPWPSRALPKAVSISPELKGVVPEEKSIEKMSKPPIRLSVASLLPGPRRDRTGKTDWYRLPECEKPYPPECGRVSTPQLKRFTVSMLICRRLCECGGA